MLFIALQLLFLLMVTWIVSFWHHQYLTESSQTHLRIAAELIRSDFFPMEEVSKADLEEKLETISKESGLEFLILDANGKVWLDPSASDAQRQNFAQRTEIRQAMYNSKAFGYHTEFNEPGRASRRSFALPVIENGKRVAIVWTAMPAEIVQESERTLYRWLWGIGLVTLLISLLIPWRLLSRHESLLQQLLRGMRAVTSGNYQHRLVPPNHGEMRYLYPAFNRMSQELSDQVSRLRQTGERLATVLGSMVEGVIAIGPDDRIQFANEAAGRLLDFPAQNSRGRPFWEVVRHSQVQRTVQSAQQGTWTGQQEIQVARTKRTVALNVTPIPGQPAQGMVLVFHDVTDLRRLERMRSEFVANVSHELKTPLTTIRAYTETLLEGALDDESHRVRFVEQIDQQAERLYQLIVDVLHLAHIESARETFEIIDIPLQEVIQDCLEQASPTAESKSIELSMLAPAEPLLVKADQEGLRTILINLIGNAVKYSPGGGFVKVKIRTEDGFALLEIEDSGFGIAEEHLERIFERFYRADKARSRALGGTGLGLAIVKHLVQRFGGQVSVRSELGKGSTFSATIPLASD
ncbi:Alkaline phosphatase synthesis sensor protein PhoR [Planctomycetales bacterium 10988]|nr:Alkaline phosphatase synthesis sensor protein PhoR [Planctomycetales bacterium 10988]